ncbi:unnamed protein product [Debaryomyces tyrocola]|nr:unnamed protein product [Debaryomyces tyrocola]
MHIVLKNFVNREPRMSCAIMTIKFLRSVWVFGWYCGSMASKECSSNPKNRKATTKRVLRQCFGAGLLYGGTKADIEREAWREGQTVGNGREP